MFIPQPFGLPAMLSPLVGELAQVALRRLFLADGLLSLRLPFLTLRLAGEPLLEIVLMAIQAPLLGLFPGLSVALFGGLDRFGLASLVSLLALGLAALLGSSGLNQSDGSR